MDRRGPLSLLDHPGAQAPLADAILTPQAVRGRRDRLTAFLARHLPKSYRAEQRPTAAPVIPGRLGGPRRKTRGPIAIAAGAPRPPIRSLVGSGEWDGEAAMAGVRRHVAEELADDRAVPVIDGTAFPKAGTGSRGAARRRRGRLGGQEDCRAGASLAYAAPGG